MQYAFLPGHGSSSRRSYSVALQGRAFLVLHRDTPEPALSTEFWAEPGAGQQEQTPLEEGGADIILTPHASSSFLPDEALLAKELSPIRDDYRTHQDLLKQVVSNLNIQAEEIRESTEDFLDIFGVASRVALPLHDVIMKPIKSLWQNPAFLSQPSTQNKNILYWPRAESSCSLTLPQGPS